MSRPPARLWPGQAPEPRFTAETIARIRRLAGQGRTAREIAEMIGPRRRRARVAGKEDEALSRLRSGFTFDPVQMLPPRPSYRGKYTIRAMIPREIWRVSDMSLLLR